MPGRALCLPGVQLTRFPGYRGLPGKDHRLAREQIGTGTRCREVTHCREQGSHPITVFSGRVSQLPRPSRRFLSASRPPPHVTLRSGAGMTPPPLVGGGEEREGGERSEIVPVRVRLPYGPNTSKSTAGHFPASGFRRRAISCSSDGYSSF